jgi:hypothetical protein
LGVKNAASFRATANRLFQPARCKPVLMPPQPEKRWMDWSGADMREELAEWMRASGQHGQSSGTSSEREADDFEIWKRAVLSGAIVFGRLASVEDSRDPIADGRISGSYVGDR